MKSWEFSWEHLVVCTLNVHVCIASVHRLCCDSSWEHLAGTMSTYWISLDPPALVSILGRCQQPPKPVTECSYLQHTLIKPDRKIQMRLVVWGNFLTRRARWNISYIQWIYLTYPSVKESIRSIWKGMAKLVRWLDKLSVPHNKTGQSDLFNQPEAFYWCKGGH